MNATRRTELEDRLRMPAPAPPPGLLEALQREIPEPLPAVQRVSRASAATRSTRWPLALAAGLLLAGVGAFALHVVSLRLVADERRGSTPRDAGLEAFARYGPPAWPRPSKPGSSAGTPSAQPARRRQVAPDVELTVRVRDAAGHALPGATVSMTAGEAVVAATDAAGVAHFRVRAGRPYELRAELRGFNPLERRDLRARAGRRSLVEVTLSEGLADTVTVTGQSPILDSRAISTSATVAPESQPGRCCRAAGGTAQQPYDDVFFRSSGTNPFVAVDDDAQSTFGLDVDTGSYGVVRRYLEDGHLPPPEAIRVEELVNAFHYGDRRGDAAGDADLNLYAEAAPVPFAKDHRYRLVRFAVAARPVPESRRKPAVLTFVIDISGSMEREERLGLVKRTLRLLLERLGEDDRVGVVVFGSRARVLLAPTNDWAAVAAAVDGLRTEDSTNTEDGLRLGFDMARSAFREGAINRVLLCSDGVANVGATGPETILARIGSEARSGIQLSTFGFGMGNYNDVLMEQLADQGNGSYAYVNDEATARRLFVDELTGTLQTVAEDARAQVEWDPRLVRRYRLLGYENRAIADERFRDDTVDGAEVGAGETVTALFQVQLVRTPEWDDPVATLHVRYRRPGETSAREVTRGLFGRDVLARPEQASTAFRLSAAVAEFAELLKRTRWTRGESFATLAAAVERLQPIPGRERELAELRDLIARANAAAEKRQAEPGEGAERPEP